MENHPECSICTHNAIFHDSRTGDERLNTPEIHERDFGIDEIITSGGDLFATNSVFIRREYYFNRPECFDCKGVGDYQQVVYAAMCGKCHYMSAVMSRYNYANNNSWTARVWADPEKRVVHFQQMINMLKNVDQYYQYQYTVPIQEKITALEYAGYKLTNNRSAMRRKKYRKYYNKEKIVRLKIWGKKVLQAVFEQEHRKR
jgi:hypothetical protein